MAHPKGNSDRFNRDLLDDGALRPLPAPAQPISEEPEEDARKMALERLRAQIQIGLDEEAAGLGKFYNSAEEIFKAIMSDDDEEEGEDTAPGKA